MEPEKIQNDFMTLRKRKRKLWPHINADEKDKDKVIKSGNSSTEKRIKKAFHSDKEFLSLPNELISQILQYLDCEGVCAMQRTCHRLNNTIKENHFWRMYSRDKFKFWNDKWFCTANELSSVQQRFNPYIGDCWKRQFVLNYTKGMYYRPLGATGQRRKSVGQIIDKCHAYGFSKVSCSRDHAFVLDYSNTLHVYKWERDHRSNYHNYRKVYWLKDFGKNVLDVTTDPKYDNCLRRYVYVLSQSEGMRNRLNHHNTRAHGSQPQNRTRMIKAGDKIDVFDERSCRRVFNMTFDPEMRFTSLTMTSLSAPSMAQQKKTLFMMTDAGKVYSLQLYEQSLLNLGSEGLQVSLKSESKQLKEKVEKISSNVGLVSFITESGKLYILCHHPSEFNDLFGEEIQNVKLRIPVSIPHIGKVVTCTVGDHHIGFLDEHNRAFVMGSNRYGQLGTGDRKNRHIPTQVLCRQKIKIFHCSLNHTLAIVWRDGRWEVHGSGCGRYGRLPGVSRGSINFTKLDIEVPWNTRQIITHKESIFLLQCFDLADKNDFSLPEADLDIEGVSKLTTKSVQELLYDMGKATALSEKWQVFEAMSERILRNEKLMQSERNRFIKAGSSTENFQEERLKLHSDDIMLFRKATKQLGHEIERINLDNKILTNKNDKEGTKET